MHCTLCTDKCYSQTQNFIYLFSTEGIQLDISNIISKHFWFQPDTKMSDRKVICLQCWKELKAFHIFYQKIERAQNMFQTKVIQTDPIENNFFYAEVKVEVDDLNLLPQIEVIEETLDISDREKRCLRRWKCIQESETKIKKDSVPESSNKPDPAFENESISQRNKIEKEGNYACISKIMDQKCEETNIEMDILHEKDMLNKSETYVTNFKFETAETYSSTKGEDSDSIPDAEHQEKYAVIPKRTIIKPKKYKKRQKPLLPPKRMTREEIENKNAKQTEYDVLIMQFFGKISCPKCDLLVKSFGDVRKHFRASHKELASFITCCGRKFYQRKSLAEHIYVHKNPEIFKCSICAKMFQDSRSLEMHILMHTNPKEKKSFQCDKCPRIFSTKAAFEYHAFSKHVPKSEFQFPCQVCDKKLPTARKLKDHLKYLHDPECAIICDKCGKQMRSQSGLRKHHEMEHSDVPRPTPVPMQCEICGTWLRHLAGLKQHMKTIHEDVGGEHRCHICNKTSTNARALKRHIYHNHECERKFKCTMCEKAFKRPQDLREHTSTHTGEVLYTCPNCPMTFFSNANMYKHRQRLHRLEWEADRKKPVPPNIMKQAVGATAAMKVQQAIGAASAFFVHKKNLKKLEDL